MIVFLWAIATILVAALMAFTAWASMVGGVAAVTDSWYERCPRCGHHGLAHRGSLHDHGCPPHHAHRLPIGHHA